MRRGSRDSGASRGSQGSSGSRQIRISASALVFGLLYAAVAVLYLVVHTTSVHIADGRWVAPVVLVGLGVAGLLAARPARRRCAGADDDASASPPSS